LRRRPHLSRFVQAQRRDYEHALSELQGCRKRSHWTWYIFPQLDGVGSSATSRLCAISGPGEAEELLQHPVLGPRLLRRAEASWLSKAGPSIFSA
jgi:uncharacterized protein (DUF1810 family)